MATSYELHFEDASGADPKTCEKGGGGGASTNLQFWKGRGPAKRNPYAKICCFQCFSDDMLTANVGARVLEEHNHNHNHKFQFLKLSTMTL